MTRSRDLSLFVHNYLHADGVLLLHFIKRNLGGRIYNELVTRLWRDYARQMDADTDENRKLEDEDDDEQQLSMKHHPSPVNSTNRLYEKKFEQIKYQPTARPHRQTSADFYRTPGFHSSWLHFSYKIM
jgi:hypothetical protein